MLRCCGLLAAAAAPAAATEDFSDESWEKRWVRSEWKKDEEKDSEGQALPQAFSNEGKDLVVQFSAKHEGHKYGFCGGGYIKLLGSKLDQSKFGGDDDYDVERIHLIFNNKETGINQKNLAKKEEIKMAYDDKNEFTHLYTLVLKPDNSYAVYFDEKEKASGKI
eukprot:gene9924-44744_t